MQQTTSGTPRDNSAGDSSAGSAAARHKPQAAGAPADAPADVRSAKSEDHTGRPWSIPSAGFLDRTLSLARDPYRFISRTCRKLNSDLFRTRLLLQKAICMTGADAAELFYDSHRMTRQGALPGWIANILFGQGGVQQSEGAAHRHRKQMLMSLMAPDRVAALGEITACLWEASALRWTSQESVVLYEESQKVLCRAVCAWAGVPLEEQEVEQRTSQLTALFDKVTSFGPGYLKARRSRKQADRWMEQIVEAIRAKRLQPPPASAAAVIAAHRDLDGKLLSARTAAVEVLNIVRPTIAVSAFITHAALVLHQHPECRQAIEFQREGYLELFAQEVRRFFPFFPALAARVRHDFDWNGYRFRRGTAVVLDLYGTNHDPRRWDHPEEFQPERFREAGVTEFDFVPQGGGDPHQGHRCPGEPIAMELIKVSAEFLCRKLTYNVPEQDLKIDFQRLPALPRSHFVIGDVTCEF